MRSGTEMFSTLRHHVSTKPDQQKGPTRSSATVLATPSAMPEPPERSNWRSTMHDNRSRAPARHHRLIEFARQAAAMHQSTNAGFLPFLGGCIGVGADRLQGPDMCCLQDIGVVERSSSGWHVKRRKGAVRKGTVPYCTKRTFTRTSTVPALVRSCSVPYEYSYRTEYRISVAHVLYQARQVDNATTSRTFAST